MSEALQHGGMDKGAQAWANWSGGVTALPQAIVQPADEAELARVLAQAPAPVRVTGTGHSFTPLCATDGTLVSLDAMQGLVSADPATKQALVKAGTKIHALGMPLYEHGLALINQGDIDRQAIAGGVATGTHGTGLGLGSFSAAVAGLRLVTPRGEVFEADRSSNEAIYQAGRLSLGALGVVSELTMQCRAAYALRETGWTQNAQEVLEDLERLSRATRHFEFWWFPYADKAICKTLDEVEGFSAAPKGLTGDKATGDAMDAEEKLVRTLMDIAWRVPMLSGFLQRLMTRMAGSESMNRHADASGKAAWSFEAFPSARNIRFNEMEYAVPAEAGPACLRELVAAIRKSGIQVCFPLEYRFVAGDDVWLSPFYGRDSVTISVHQYHKQDYAPLFSLCERIFRRYDGRPHWGKIHSMSAAEFSSVYPRWRDFLEVRAALDPEGRMLNDHLRTLFGTEGTVLSAAAQ